MGTLADEKSWDIRSKQITDAKPLTMVHRFVTRQDMAMDIMYIKMVSLITQEACSTVNLKF